MWNKLQKEIALFVFERYEKITIVKFNFFSLDQGLVIVLYQLFVRRPEKNVCDIHFSYFNAKWKKVF